ncbi:uncharacterized protein [Dysidea avara]|uniref:uncharacterized protein n=1 Tax=Dysidea avara TaxID=196820 RepID=UPI0033290E3E
MDKVITTFSEQLITLLQLDDVKFRAKLQYAGLFYGNLKEEVKAKSTPAEMNEHFLDHGIKNDEARFLKLLTVMEEFDCNLLKSLARQTRNEIGHEPAPLDGTPQDPPAKEKNVTDLKLEVDHFYYFKEEDYFYST